MRNFKVGKGKFEVGEKIFGIYGYFLIFRYICISIYVCANVCVCVDNYMYICIFNIYWKWRLFKLKRFSLDIERISKIKYWDNG